MKKTLPATILVSSTITLFADISATINAVPTISPKHPKQTTSLTVSKGEGNVSFILQQPSMNRQSTCPP